ncbi:Glutathione s-transferase-like protein [Hibiscus syriacus]|uniref:Glutathione s-transferase-like protein n=1 Tax=Hibiscus syriacus TaxID=106335 RepID=A0A6A3BL15_HIBSY|nr:Glutathione s-transferase-like protein [Hibiscus syriacus]
MGLIVLVSILEIGKVNAAGECGKSSPDNEALKLAPCAEASQDAKAPVSAACCAHLYASLKWKFGNWKTDAGAHLYY